MQAAWATVREERDPAFWQAVADHPRFWITGLPRSRTAWFSVALGCPHELTAQAPSYADLCSLWTAGNADSACGLQIEAILRDLAPRTLVIERPLDDVLHSAEAAMGCDLWHARPLFEQLEAALRHEHPLIKRVRFADLQDRDALIEAAEWLVPGSGDRATGLMNMNIQVSRQRARALMNLDHSGWHMKRAA